MLGPRMRAYSLGGTRPDSASRSVPRLMAPWSARTETSPDPGAATASRRSSARPGATYHNASASAPDRSLTTRAFHRLEALSLVIPPAGRKGRAGPAVTERGNAGDLTPARTRLSTTRPRVLFSTLALSPLVGRLRLHAAAPAPRQLDH